MLMTVFYAKEMPFPFGKVFPELTADNLLETHVELKTVDLPGLDAVYHEMQGEVWSPNGEARELIRSLGLNHTSMSVGDVIKTPDGKLHLVASCGFEERG